MDFKNKTILIAGATVGIGKATAILLSKLGARIILVSSNELRLKEVKVKLIKGQKEHLYSTIDLRQVDSIEEKLKELTTISGPIDGFVYCVGQRSRRPLKMLSPTIISEVLTVNFIAFIEMMRSLTKRNRFSAGFSAVAVSSIAAQSGSAGVTAYAASKAAMEGAVRCLGKELASKKIRVNAVVPAQINTPAYEKFIEMNQSGEDDTLARQYLGLGQPENVAAAISFLLSNNSAFISGTCLPVDGGYLSS